MKYNSVLLLLLLIISRSTCLIINTNTNRYGSKKSNMIVFAKRKDFNPNNKHVSHSALEVALHANYLWIEAEEEHDDSSGGALNLVRIIALERSQGFFYEKGIDVNEAIRRLKLYADYKEYPEGIVAVYRPPCIETLSDDVFNFFIFEIEGVVTTKAVLISEKTLCAQFCGRY